MRIEFGTLVIMNSKIIVGSFKDVEGYSQKTLLRNAARAKDVVLKLSQSITTMPFNVPLNS